MTMMRLALVVVASLGFAVGCDPAPQPPAGAAPVAAPLAGQPAPAPPAPGGDAPATRPASDATRQRAQQAVDNAARFVRQTRDRFMKDVQSQFDAVQKRIDELKRSADQNWAQVEERVAKLKEQAEAARQALERAREGGSQAWQNAQGAFDGVMRELRELTGVPAPTTQPLGDARDPASPATKPAPPPGS
jgi:hypothetical protein